MILLIPNCSGRILLHIWFTLVLLPHYFNFDTEFVGVYNSVQLWHHLELAQTPHVKDSLPQNSTQPHSTPFHENKSQIVSCNSDRPVINHRFPRTPQVQLFARTHTTQEGMLFIFTRKDTIQEQMEEMCRARCGGRGTEVPRPLWAHHHPSTSMCLPTWKLSESWSFFSGFFYGVSHLILAKRPRSDYGVSSHTRDWVIIGYWWLTSISSPFPLPWGWEVWLKVTSL